MSILNTNKEHAVIFEKLKLFYASWSTKELAIIDTLFCKEWKDIPQAPDLPEGTQGLKQLITIFKDTFSDVKITVLDMFGTKDRIAVRAELTFTHHKEFMGIPPTHKKVTIALFEIHEVLEGQIKNTWHLEDWFSLLKQ